MLYETINWAISYNDEPTQHNRNTDSFFSMYIRATCGFKSLPEAAHFSLEKN